MVGLSGVLGSPGLAGVRIRYRNRRILISVRARIRLRIITTSAITAATAKP